MRYRPQIQPSLRLHTVLFVVLVGSLSNDDGDGYGYENVTGKVNSRCLVKCWQMSLELNSKGLYQSHDKKNKIVVLCSGSRQNVKSGVFTL